MTDFIERKLLSRFDGEEWDCQRVLLNAVPEHNQFITANILTILSHCTIHTPELLTTIQTAKRCLSQYQRGHQVYHWRLKEGLSLPDNAPYLNALRLMKLDPDADCTALQALALDDSSHLEAIVQDLEFYRLDSVRFRLPDFQRAVLPRADGVFLVWFPPKSRCLNQKIEQLDIVVQAHILWLLQRFNRLDCNGRSETIAFLKSVIESDLILENPYAVSPYYPFPLVILYALSRAIIWGKIDALYNMRERLLNMTRRVLPTNDLERLCTASIGKYWNDGALQATLRLEPLLKMKTGAFYAATNAHRYFEWLSRSRWTRFEFHSEALQWAMLKWLLE
ncbi:MAG: hypothetical protein SNJ55_02090 [Chloroherpetonaceae bacterium]